MSSDPDNFDFNKPIDILKDLSGAKFVAINTYEYERSKSVTRGLVGIPSEIQRASEMLGFEIIGHSWNMIPERIRELRGSKLICYETLYSTSMGQLKKTQSALIHKIFGIGIIYVIELAYGARNPLGDIIFFMPKDTEIKNREAIEIYAGLVHISLSKFKEHIELKKSEEKYKTIVENQTEFITKVAPDGTLSFANDSFCRFLGLTYQEVIGKNIFRDIKFTVHPSDIQKLDNHFKSFNPHNPTKSIELRLMHQTRGPTWVEWKDRAIFDESGKLIEFHSVGRDITERKKLEKDLNYRLALEETISTISKRFTELGDLDEAIELSLEEIGEITNSDRAFAFTLSEDGLTIKKAHEWCKEEIETYTHLLLGKPVEIFPWTLEKFLKRELLIVEDVSKLPPEAEKEKRVLEAQKVKSAILAPLYLKDNIFGFIGFESVSNVKFWKEKDINFLEVVSQIINSAYERNFAFNFIKKSEEKYRALFERNPGYTYIMSPEGTFLDLNEAALKALCYEKSELLGKHRSAIYPPESIEKMKHIFDKLEKEGYLKNEEITIVGKYGKKRNVLVSTEKIYGKEGKWIASVSIHIDITERKLAEDKLLNERAQMLSIFDGINEAIYVCDVNTYEILFANEFVKRLYSKDLVGGTCYREIQNKDAPCDFCTNSIILQNKGKPYQWDYHNSYLSKDFLVTDKIIKWSDGRDVRFTMAIDITERKMMENKLIETNKKLEEIIEFFPDALIIMDNDRKIITWNKVMEDMTGISKEEILGKDMSYLGAACYGKPREHLADLVFDPNSEIKSKYKFIGQKGRAIYTEVFVPAFYNNKGAYVAVIAAPLLGPNGDVIGVIESVRDITDRKESEEKLKESENTLKGIFAAAPIGINLFKDRVWVWSNKGMEEITGYEMSEMVGKTPRFLYESDEEYERVGKILHQSPGEKEVNEVYTQFITKSGSIKEAYVRNSPLDPEDPSKGHITVTLDITDRIKSQKQLDENLVYFAHLVDQIRNPLAIISGFAQVEVENEKTRERFLRQIDRIEELMKQFDEGWMNTECTRRFLRNYM